MQAAAAWQVQNTVHVGGDYDSLCVQLGTAVRHRVLSTCTHKHTIPQTPTVQCKGQVATFPGYALVTKQTLPLWQTGGGGRGRCVQ